MIYAEVAVTIRRPRHDVAAVMFNPHYDPAWIGGVIQARPVVPGPLRRGVKIAWERRRLGRRIADVREVTDHVPERCVETIGDGPCHLRIRYELEGIPEGTIARVRAEGSPSGWLRYVVPAINVWLRRAVIRDLDRLKSLVESEAWRALAA